jgi:putative selenium metabolism hydrolase
MSNQYKEIRARAAELQSGIAGFLVELIRTPSFSGKEREVVDVIAAKMLANMFDEVKVDGLGNVIGRIGSGPRLLAFDAHIDTVYPGELALWSFPPFESDVRNGKVWGRGATDQKSGMAAMVYAGRIIKELGLNREFTILFTGTVMEEDCDGLCWQYLINEEHIKPELVVITEPTNLGIYRGHRGRMEIHVEVTGRSCHGSAPERGDNAIYKAARIALELEKLNSGLRADAFLGKGSMTVTECVTGSPSLCAVPDHARLHIDRRLTLGETKESALGEVEEAARRAGVPDAVVSVLEYAEPAYTGLIYPAEKYYPTWTLDADSSYLKHAIGAYRTLFDREPVVDKWTFSTNAVAVAGMNGIPCLGLGPGNEVLAHAPDEYCPVDHLDAAAAFYAGLAASLNGIENA